MGEMIRDNYMDSVLEELSKTEGVTIIRDEDKKV